LPAIAKSTQSRSPKPNRRLAVRFCIYCGRKRGAGHAKTCPNYVAPEPQPTPLQAVTAALGHNGGPSLDVPQTPAPPEPKKDLDRLEGDIMIGVRSITEFLRRITGIHDLSEAKVYRWINIGAIPATKVGVLLTGSKTTILKYLQTPPIIMVEPQNEPGS
jgi:hypothetical protein